MKVGVVQSNYVPWRGYFDFIKSVDVFVLYDDVAYSKGTYRNRNQLKFVDGLRWLTVPVNGRISMAVDEVLIDPRSDWVGRHERLLTESLGDAPHFSDALSLWKAGVDSGDRRLSRLNRRLISAACDYLGIATRLVDSRELQPAGRGTERVIDLLRKVGARTYLSGPAAKAYLDESQFREHGIRLEYKSYDYAPYPQLHGPFTGSVSVLDLIANCGPQSSALLASRKANEVAVP